MKRDTNRLTVPRVIDQVLDGKTVTARNWSISINDKDEVEIWPPNGDGFITNISNLSKAAKDFCKKANMPIPGVNEQQPDAVSYEDNVLGPDTSVEDPTELEADEINEQVDPADQKGTSLPSVDLGKDTSSKSSPVMNPVINKRPDRQDTEMSNPDIGPDTSSNETKWGNKIIDTFDKPDDNKKFYREFYAKRPSEELLKDIMNPAKWSANRILSENVFDPKVNEQVDPSDQKGVKPSKLELKDEAESRKNKDVKTSNKIHYINSLLDKGEIKKVAFLCKKAMHSYGLTANDKVIAVSPPGWKKTVEKMKSHDEISNPFALAWWMHDKGYKPHNKESKKKVAGDQWKQVLEILKDHQELEPRIDFMAEVWNGGIMQWIDNRYNTIENRESINDMASQLGVHEIELILDHIPEDLNTSDLSESQYERLSNKFGKYDSMCYDKVFPRLEEKIVEYYQESDDDSNRQAQRYPADRGDGSRVMVSVPEDEKYEDEDSIEALYESWINGNRKDVVNKIHEAGPALAVELADLLDEEDKLIFMKLLNNRITGLRRQAGPKLREKWNQDGSYGRDIEAESAEELHNLVRGFGGEEVDWAKMVKPKMPDEKVIEGSGETPGEPEDHVSTKPSTMAKRKAVDEEACSDGKEAVDDKAKDYWSGYMGNYGKQLTKDNVGKKTPKKDDKKAQAVPAPTAPAVPKTPSMPTETPVSKTPVKPPVKNTSPGSGDAGLEALGWSVEDIQFMDDEDKQKILQVKLNKPGTKKTAPGAAPNTTTRPVTSPSAPTPPGDPINQQPAAPSTPGSEDRPMPPLAKVKMAHQILSKIRIKRAQQVLQEENVPPVEPAATPIKNAPTTPERMPGLETEPTDGTETDEQKAFRILSEVQSMDVNASSPEQIVSIKASELAKRLTTEIGMTLSEAKSIYNVQNKSILTLFQ